jgi:hypothetical protein
MGCDCCDCQLICIRFLIVILGIVFIGLVVIASIAVSNFSYFLALEVIVIIFGIFGFIISIFGFIGVGFGVKNQNKVFFFFFDL